jgi:hypothetical protein
MANQLSSQELDRVSHRVLQTSVGTSSITLTVDRYQLLFRKAATREELQCRDRRSCLASRSPEAHRRIHLPATCSLCQDRRGDVGSTHEHVRRRRERVRWCRYSMLLTGFQNTTFGFLQHHANINVNRYAPAPASSNHTGPTSGTHLEPQSPKMILTAPTESATTLVWTSIWFIPFERRSWRSPAG